MGRAEGSSSAPQRASRSRASSDASDAPTRLELAIARTFPPMAVPSQGAATNAWPLVARRTAVKMSGRMALGPTLGC
eukprot:618875-Pyramimonas_sp.AAC.1